METAAALLIALPPLLAAHHAAMAAMQACGPRMRSVPRGMIGLAAFLACYTALVLVLLTLLFLAAPELYHQLWAG